MMHASCSFSSSPASGKGDGELHVRVRARQSCRDGHTRAQHLTNLGRGASLSAFPPGRRPGSTCRWRAHTVPQE